MDLDDFKLVNDSLGHPAGDTLLIQAAERLLGCVRTSDTVARVGGDEFAVLMEGLPELSRLVAHRVVAAFEEPFVIDGQQLLMRPSVGLAVAIGGQPGPVGGRAAQAGRCGDVLGEAIEVRWPAHLHPGHGVRPIRMSSSCRPRRARARNAVRRSGSSANCVMPSTMAT